MLLPFCAINAQEGRLLRFPSVGGDKIAFSYAGDLYTVSINGGTAQKITSDIGYEMFSRFSPDGKTIAFTAQYDGNTEVYTIPSAGGIPKRITYSASVSRDMVGERMGPNNIVMCWTPDGKNIVYRSKWYNFSGLRGLLYTISANGGEPTQIPTTEGGFCSYSPDGKQLAFNRMFREFRTWKYYRGGQADDIWINQVGSTKLDNITNNPAQDIFPMWIGNDIYFLSDRDHIMNLFCYNTKSKEVSKVTNFTEYDCKFPSFSNNYVVFENGGYIYKYSVSNKKCEKVKIELNCEDIYARSKYNKSPENAFFSRSGYSLSPDGEKVLAIHRGDIFSIPAQKGATYNLSNSSESHEREATWSPDGKSIAFFSDKSGEYQLYLMDGENTEKVTMLTKFKEGYPTGLLWSPDSKKIYFSNEKRELCSIDVASKALKVIITGKYSGIYNYDFSNDGNWLVYTTSGKNRVSVIYIYDIKADKHHQVTGQWYDSSSPIFSEDGKYLFFTSSRDFNANYSYVEWNASYEVKNYVFVTPLTKETTDPTIINVSVDKNGDAKGDKTQNSTIDFDGIVERSALLPIESGRYSLLTCINDELYYSSKGEIKKISMKDMKISSVADGRILAATTDGSKALLAEKNNLYVVSSKQGFKKDDPLSLQDVNTLVDYPKEWAQIFNESWRIVRDHFYLENMHGKDWNKLRDKYSVLLPYVRHRQDLTYIIGEMISELNVGHAYITTGEAPTPERIGTGLLGGKFEKDKSGYFKITKIFQGAPWESTLVSPLGAPGIKVNCGEYIISVNGTSCKEMGTIYQSLIGKVGSTVALKINSQPKEEGARIVYVKPIGDESNLAYYEWVQNNIKKVNEATNGEVGYIHIPDMSVAGLDAFTKLFYTQLDKKALIIDDRMNGGGNVSPMILERLQREAYRMTMARNGGELLSTVPGETHHGPKVCLVDKYSSSDGDLFPYGFQKLGIGKLIGTRTWGGIVGISGSKEFVDGQDMRTPFFTSYSIDGKWIVENHGVDPDIVVDINPFDDYLGVDAQLNKAIEVLKEEMKNYKPLPGVPAPRKMD